ncbi:hypothetical protein D3C87_1912270 [compost metagenome]
MIIPEISSVPCVNTTRIDLKPRLWAKNICSKTPSIRLFLNSRYIVPTEQVMPARKNMNMTRILFQVICRNILNSPWSLYTLNGSPEEILAMVIST